jgi:hypothetical protein
VWAWLSAAWAAAAAVAAPQQAATFQFELLGATTDWVIVRENIPATSADTAACAYPRLDPSEHVGVTVRFLPLPPPAQRGRLMPVEAGDTPMPLYSPSRRGSPCTTAAEAQQRWAAIVARAARVGIELRADPLVPIVLGAPVPATACVLLRRGTARPAQCSAVYTRQIDGQRFRIAVSLAAVPEAPDGAACQYAGHRFSAALQVDGLDFGAAGSEVAPGGLADHYDCRGQQFEPLRLYAGGGVAVLLGGFRGTNIADRATYPFVIVFPTRP